MKLDFDPPCLNTLYPHHYSRTTTTVKRPFDFAAQWIVLDNGVMQNQTVDCCVLWERFLGSELEFHVDGRILQILVMFGEIDNGQRGILFEFASTQERFAVLLAIVSALEVGVHIVLLRPGVVGQIQVHVRIWVTLGVEKELDIG